MVMGSDFKYLFQGAKLADNRQSLLSSANLWPTWLVMAENCQYICEVVAVPVARGEY